LNEEKISKTFKHHLIIPNLGQPLFLNIDANRLKRKDFELDLVYVSNVNNKDDFESLIKDKITLTPILEFKWKLKSILAKDNREWLLKFENVKKQSFWKKIKAFLTRRKKIRRDISNNPLDIIDSSGKHFIFPVDGNLKKKIKRLAFRGEHLSVDILNVESVDNTEITKKDYDCYTYPRNYLVKQDIFGLLLYYYRVKVKFKLSNEVRDYLHDYNFIMFDINVNNGTEDTNINYHSIVISKNDWYNFKFVQATDLHLAERNDKIYELVKNWTSLVRKSDIGDLVTEGMKTLSFIQRLFTPKPKPISEIKTTKPLPKRYINPNNNFRKFIKLMNRKVLENDLDFIALTGDLIDYAILSKVPKDVRKVTDYDYDRSNWKTFQEIVLGIPQKQRRGMKKNRELLCPIFTIAGNHEFRPYHYDIRWGGLYKKIGLNVNEALALNDELMANPISSITKSFRALKAYLIHINSSLDFFLKLRDNNFIFLNSGSDSFKKLMDFVSGHPSVTGLSNRQIIFLENLVNSGKIKKGENTYLFLHGPPINPKNTISVFKRRGKSEDQILTKIDEYKESLVLKLGKKLKSARIDEKFDVRYGVIATNWEKLMLFSREYCTLTIAGHTHHLKEFRLGNPSPEQDIVETKSFTLKKLDNPAAIYYDIYSEIYSTQKEIEKNGPFVVQTPALGLGSYFNPKSAGAYREFVIEKGKLTSFKVKDINR
jgi:hypothetical protein